MPRKTRLTLQAADALRFNAAFGTYCRTGGDLAATADAHKLDALALANHARLEAWAEKLDAIKTATGASMSGERLVNRAMSFAAAARLRQLVNCIFGDFLGQVSRGETAASDLFRTVDDKGRSTFNAKGLADLSRALQVADNTTAKALGDTVTERLESPEREEGPDMASAQLAVITALGGHGAPMAALPAPAAPVPPAQPAPAPAPAQAQAQAESAPLREATVTKCHTPKPAEAPSVPKCHTTPSEGPEAW